MRLLHYICIVWCVISVNTLTIAQNGRFGVRFIVKQNDCIARQTVISVQVRSTSVDSNFLMGDANYRFEYDPRKIRNPRIVSQEHFSNRLPANDPNYGVQNLNGSSAGTNLGIVSLNTFYLGSNNGARLVDTAWQSITDIGFDVVSDTSCFNLVWHDDQTFPISGMTEVIVTQSAPFDYNLASVASGHIWQNVNACFNTFCNNNNLPPTVAFTPVIVPQDSVKTVCATIQDLNIADKHHVNFCAVPRNGIATMQLDTNTRQLCVTYRPQAGFIGRDSICITVCDNRIDSLCRNTTIQLTITATPRSDTASIGIIPIITPKDSLFNGCFGIINRDTNKIYTVVPCSNARHGVIQMSTTTNGQVCITYQPTFGFVGIDSFCIRLCDNTNKCRNQTIIITVTPCVDRTAPIIVCPQASTVSAFGEIVSDASNFLRTAKMNSSCSGVRITYGTLTATDDCSSTPSVTLSSGIISGDVFPTGLSSLIFTAKDSAGRTSTCTATINVLPREQLIASTLDTITVCKSENLTVSAKAITGATYRWVGPNGFASAASRATLTPFIIGNGGLFTVAVTTNGCTYNDSIQVAIINKPILVNDVYTTATTLTANVLANDTLTQNLRTTVSLIADVTNGNLLLTPQGVFTYTPPLGFVGTVTFAYKVCYDYCPSNCEIATGRIKVASGNRQDNQATNIITPNGDGLNETLVITNFDPTKTPNESEITVYNQWGDVVFKTLAYKNDWNGTYNNAALPDGTYYFIFKRSAVDEPIKEFVTVMH